MVVTNDNYLTPAATLGNPFPAGFQQTAGSSRGLSTFLGQTFSRLFAAPDTRATNSAFATITSQADRPRTIQLGSRFVF